MNSRSIFDTYKHQQAIIYCISLMLTLIPVWMIEQSVLHHTNGIFCYPLDDTFIHMQVASNLAGRHTWGIQANEFGSASSSILYTLVLAFFFYLSPGNIYIPLFINIVTSAILLLVVQKWLFRQNIKGWSCVFVMACIIFFTPLPIMIVSGMEHTLQCLFSFLLISRFAELSGKEGESKKTLTPDIYVYGFMTAFLRYEGLFLVGVICLILLFEKKLRQSIVFGLVSSFPLIVFGFFSLTKGSFFFPNSVVVKQTILSPQTGIADFISNILIDRLTIDKTGITLLATQRLLIIVPLTWFFFKAKGGTTSLRVWTIVLTLCTLLQLALGATGWFYRYEAYLVMCSVILVSVLLYHNRQQLRFTNFRNLALLKLVMIFFLVFPLILRSLAGFTKASRAAVNIYEQQYQMGHFLEANYKNDMVAINDIGAVSFYKKQGVLDLWGLGSIEVAKSRKHNTWTPDFLDSIARQKKVKVAVLYNNWFSDSLLHRWSNVASWQIPDNVICAGDVVTFYAVDPSAAAALRTYLQQYAQKLPAEVKVYYSK